jgi:putative phosphoribosyl transferase
MTIRRRRRAPKKKARAHWGTADAEFSAGLPGLMSPAAASDLVPPRLVGVAPRGPLPTPRWFTHLPTLARSLIKVVAMRFRDRSAAGRLLARELTHYEKRSPLVFAVPRGGVPVGVEIAASLNTPLDVSMVLKINAPSRPQLDLGVVSEAGEHYVGRDMLEVSHVSNDELAALTSVRRAALDERLRAFRGDAPSLDVKGRTVIVVDDGIATGLTAWGAVKAMRERGATCVVLATPVAPAPIVDLLRTVVDEVVCLMSPQNLWSIGSWYGDFEPVSEGEASESLRRASSRPPPPLSQAPSWAGGRRALGRAALAALAAYSACAAETDAPGVDTVASADDR